MGCKGWACTGWAPQMALLSAKELRVRYIGGLVMLVFIIHLIMSTSPSGIGSAIYYEQAPFFHCDRGAAKQPLHTFRKGPAPYFLQRYKKQAGMDSALDPVA